MLIVTKGQTFNCRGYFDILVELNIILYFGIKIKKITEISPVDLVTSVFVVEWFECRDVKFGTKQQKYGTFSHQISEFFTRRAKMYGNLTHFGTQSDI